MIQSFLENRRFCVKLDERKSRWRNQKNGLQQGSVLAPTLFNIYTNDQPQFDKIRLLSWELSSHYMTNPKKTQVYVYHLNNYQAHKIQHHLEWPNTGQGQLPEIPKSSTWPNLIGSFSNIFGNFRSFPNITRWPDTADHPKGTATPQPKDNTKTAVDPSTLWHQRERTRRQIVQGGKKASSNQASDLLPRNQTHLEEPLPQCLETTHWCCWERRHPASGQSPAGGHLPTKDRTLPSFIPPLVSESLSVVFSSQPVIYGSFPVVSGHFERFGFVSGHFRFVQSCFRYVFGS